MKHTLILLAASAAMLAIGSCARTSAPAAPLTDADDSTDAVYTGVLPAADVEGIRYTLLLDFDDDNNSGDYDLVQTYFMTDSTGVSDVASFATEGDFTVRQTPAGKPCLTLSGDGAGSMYFLVDTDSTLVMTDSSITPATTPGLNYTLKKAN